MKKVFLFISLLLFISSCSKENPVEKTKEDPTASLTTSDTLRREVIKDVFLFADSLKDTYSLDDNIYAKVHLKNENNASGLHIFVGNYPPLLGWFCFDSNNELVNSGPSTMGLAEFNQTLKGGQELNESLTWEQSSRSGLKAFAGDYTLELYFRGVNSKGLLKHFKITEQGDPFSYYLYREYSVKDTVKINFLLRNRISKAITLNSSSVSSEFLLINNSNQKSDTVFVQKFTLDKSVYNLDPKSDNLLFKLSRPLQDFKNQGINGPYDMVLNLYFKEKTVSVRKLVIII